MLSAWEWQPGPITVKQAWRWWTAAWVHWSTGHALANVLGLTLVAALGWAARLPLWAATAWLIAWPLTHVGLALSGPWAEGLLHYRGLSGVLHAGVAVAVVALVLTPCSPAQRRWGCALGLGLVIKLVHEQPWVPGPKLVPGWAVPLAPQGHACGALAGAACALLLVLWRRALGPPPRPVTS